MSARKKLAALSQTEQEQLVLLHEEARKRGVDLVNLLTLLKSAKDKPDACPSIKSVKEELITTKNKAGRDERYLNGLGWILDEFMNGQETMAIDRFGLVEVEKYLDTKKLISRSCFRGRLSTLFNFAVRRGYIISNPCTRLESVTVTRPHPHILTVEETKKCLSWLRKNPRAFGWFVLSTFAGLRPEEAEKTTWKDINFDECWIRVEAQTTKVRQRRVVYPPKMTFDWLRVVKASGCKIVISRNIRSDILVDLRGVLGWSAWKQDVTRHSCASYWLSDCGSAATVATALGHSEGKLRKHYMALVTKADAERFWAISPKEPSLKRRRVPAVPPSPTDTASVALA